MGRHVTIVAGYFEANWFSKSPENFPEWLKELKAKMESAAVNVNVTLLVLDNTDVVGVVMIKRLSKKFGSTKTKDVWICNIVRFTIWCGVNKAQ